MFFSEEAMYWLVELNNKQYKIERGKAAIVDKLNVEVGSEIPIDKVLLSRGDKDEVQIGTPYIKDMVLKAKVLGDVSGKKIRIFKYKRRKDYRRTMGTRPQFTRILVSK
jgi:large subunit ribosomal protein L21